VLELLSAPNAGSAIITINGGRAVAISGNGATTVLQVDAGANAIVTGLAITHGHSAGSGGGILNNGTLTIQNCTLSGNVASQDGGAIASTGTLTVQNCTLAGNSAGGNGGAISTSGPLTIQSSTLSANTASKGGGIASSGSLTLQNSIVAANTAGSSNPDILGTIGNDAGNNLLGTVQVGGASLSTDHFTDTPGLAALGNYGSFLQTMGLLSGSAAIGGGSARGAPACDERGVARRRDSHGRMVVDIGAFEGVIRAAVNGVRH
jgi:predicted outer membrane repeat protein